jgi:hypothetical protein
MKQPVLIVPRLNVASDRQFTFWIKKAVHFGNKTKKNKVIEHQSRNGAEK